MFCSGRGITAKNNLTAAELEHKMKLLHSVRGGGKTEKTNRFSHILKELPVTSFQ